MVVVTCHQVVMMLTAIWAPFALGDRTREHFTLSDIGLQ